MNLGRHRANHLKPPRSAVARARIVVPDRDDTRYEADLAVTCTPEPPEPSTSSIPS